MDRPVSESCDGLRLARFDIHLIKVTQIDSVILIVGQNRDVVVTVVGHIRVESVPRVVSWVHCVVFVSHTELRFMTFVFIRYKSNLI